MTPSKPPTSLTKLLLLPLLSLITCSNANTEKTIFTAPLPISLSSSKLPPLLHDIPVLGPSTQLSIRTNLTRVFPTQHRDANEEGTEGNENEEPGSPSWLLLDHLTPGQRYELRVCWSALVSPTIPFNLKVHIPFSLKVQKEDVSHFSLFFIFIFNL